MIGFYDIFALYKTGRRDLRNKLSEGKCDIQTGPRSWFNSFVTLSESLNF